MFIYVIIEAVLGIVAGILLAVCSKKAEGVTYGKLDKAGIVTNIVLIPVYLVISIFAMIIASLFSPHYDGFLGILGWIVSVIGATGPSLCGIGLGASVALRKKGKSKESFIVQFAGVVGIGLSVGLYCIFAGNLLHYLN